MSIQYCHDCDTYIDLDDDAEHFELNKLGKKRCEEEEREK